MTGVHPELDEGRRDQRPTQEDPTIQPTLTLPSSATLTHQNVIWNYESPTGK
ncbi:MAG: hypothetical protein IIA53_08440 [Chloroflexi bacterium]|nr:hypothetical protein [Chloroflexota bacterium]